MKRYSEKHRRYLLRRARTAPFRDLDRRLRGKAETYRATVAAVAAEIRRLNPEVDPSAPLYLRPLQGSLDVVSTAESAITQFNSLTTVPTGRKRGIRVRIGMDEVENIDAAGILFLCSRIRWLRENARAHMLGSYPRSFKARKTIIDGGFENFLLERPRFYKKGEPSLKLIRGDYWALGAHEPRMIDPRVPSEVKQFLSDRNPSLSVEEADQLYWAVLECLENVKQHAYRRELYEEGRLGSPGGWYVVGLSDEEKRSSTVAILDVGVGIENSVKFQLSRIEKLKEWLTKTPQQLVSLAVRGLRTETGTPERGRGLSSLMEFAMNAPGRRLHVLSSTAMVTCGSDGVSTCSVPQFEGTVVCLEISASQGVAP